MTITQSDVGLVIAWIIEPPLDGEMDTLEELKEAGWQSELFFDLPLPVYNISTAALTDSDPLSAAEIIAFIDVTQKQPWNQPIEPRPMPTRVGPTGEELPLISPLDSPQSAIPEEPVFVLREGIQRGVRRFVIAVSPLYQEGDSVMLATQGTAWLIGVSHVEESGIRFSQPLQPAESLEQDEPDNNDFSPESPLPTPISTRSVPSGGLRLTSPLAIPTAANLLSPLPTPSPTEGAPSGGIRLTSPLTQPTALNLLSPLPTPIAIPAVPTAPTEVSPIELPSVGADTGVISLTTSLTTSVTPGDDSAGAQAAPPVIRPVPESIRVPWSGVLLFTFFGFTIVLTLLRRGE